MSGNRPFTRIFFVTDIHGSERCFKKFMASANFYKADVLILGGDVTGKMIIPIIKQPEGMYIADFLGEKVTAKTETEVADLETRIRDSGFYPHIVTPEENEEFTNDSKKLDELFRRIMKETLIRWVSMAEEKLKNLNVTCYMTGGNDDHQEVMDAFKDTEHVKNPENKLVYLDESHEMVSLGWGNPTPWKCPRDCGSEEELGVLVEKAVAEVKDFPNAVFNFHVPPKDCTLDDAPALDTSVFPPKPILQAGRQVMIPVGSSSIRSSVEKYQPLLVLSGHIHESRGVAKIGKSLIINPGSEYSEGIMRGVIVNLGDRKVKSYQLTSG